MARRTTADGGLTRAGLHAAVLEGSLVHVLIVTPVIFTWLRERELAR